MKKLVLIVLIMFVVTLGYLNSAQADGCYICKGGSYVAYTGDDTQDKRKAAQACGCEIGGTRGDCSAANLTVLCTVENEEPTDDKVAQEN